ncbi:ribosomal protection-like ABC-F family protein [Fusibacter sp. JL216-2]|uniref:ribosomal protection-like ABC-F family protein n=1 Tax=Fusibacter sp. JL216-2 TaxID=3071453 RepID=UPI003D327B92
MSLLHFHKIEKEFGNRTVLNGIDLSIERRERVALIGDNGTGKSTLLRIAMGVETADLGRVITAKGIKIGYLSQDSDELTSGRQNALYIDAHQKLEQRIKKLEAEMAHPDTLASPKIFDHVMRMYERAIHEYEAMDGYTLESTIKKTLLGLGLSPDALSRPLESLSGGERMRVALARVLIEDPDLLILDEPTNHLDLPGIEWLEDFLMRFSGGVLLVSHDRYFLDKVTTRTAELDGGKLLIKSCNYSTFMTQKENIRAYYLKEGKNMKIRLRDKKAQVENLLSNNKIKQAKSRMREIEKMEEDLKKHSSHLKNKEHLGRKSGPQLKIRAHGHISKEIAWGKNVTKAFKTRTLFQNISFHIAGGERVGIIGPNGCGKSTLLKMLMGEDKSFTGELKLGSWLNYCYLGQSVAFEDEDLSVLDEIMMVSGMEEADSRQHLSKFQFYGDAVDTPLSSLSGGERVRVYLAEIMLKSPHLLILDEPTNHLDLASREAIERAVHDFRGTVIAVSHDRYYLNNCVDKVLAFHNGCLKTIKGNYDTYKTYIQNMNADIEPNTVSNTSQSAKELQEKNRHTQSTSENISEKQSRKQEDVEADIIADEKALADLFKAIETSSVDTLHTHQDLDVYSKLAQIEKRLNKLYTEYEQLEA